VNWNQWTGIGRLTKAPDLRYTKSGNPVCNFSLACNRQYTTQSGERRDDVTFVEVSAWGKSAETISQYVGPGRPILVAGHLKNEKWIDKATGQDRSRIVVVLETFRFMDKKDDGPQTSGTRSTAPAPHPAPADESDEVPF